MRWVKNIFFFVRQKKCDAFKIFLYSQHSHFLSYFVKKLKNNILWERKFVISFVYFPGRSLVTLSHSLSSSPGRSGVPRLRGLLRLAAIRDRRRSRWRDRAFVIMVRKFKIQN